MTVRLLYVGNLRSGGNGRDRVAALAATGLAVEGFDTFPYITAGTRLGRSVAARYAIGPSVKRLNAELTRRAAQRGFDAVLVDKGVWICPDTLRCLKASAELGLAVHYTPDAQFLENRSRHFFSALPDYDLLVTTKDFEISNYREAGARELLLILQGYGQRLIPVPRTDVPATLRSEICFIGHCQPAYSALLMRLAKNVPLAIWGPGWPELARRQPWARAVVRGGGLYGPDYARALSGAKIAVGLLSKRIPETTTTRSFEIPACGTMMLAERTAAHSALFEEGKEAEFFSDAEELCDKAAFYLANDTARTNIAEAGYRRAASSGYSAEAQFARIANWLEKRARGIEDRVAG